MLLKSNTVKITAVPRELREDTCHKYRDYAHCAPKEANTRRKLVQTPHSVNYRSFTWMFTASKRGPEHIVPICVMARGYVTLFLRCEGIVVACQSCGSENQTEFPSEISVHHPGLEKVDEPTVMLFHKLLTCMSCGFTEFRISDDDLHLLGKGSASDVDAVG